MRRTLGAAVTLVAALAMSSWLGAGGVRAGTAARSEIAGQPLTPSGLAADLLAAAHIRQVPPDLDPPLSAAGGAVPLIVKNGCHLPRTGLRSKPCVYGDPASRTTVVLFGDSHAAYWFPAVDQISIEQHWRLVDLTKDGCPAAEVNIAAWFRGGGPYPECVEWRRSAMAQIAALRPTLVITTEARYLEVPEARPLAGVPGGHGGPWEDGVAAIFSFLRGHSRHVLFLSDVPTQQQSAPGCVARHSSDVQLCATPRGAAVRLPSVKAKERALARSEHVDWADPTSWFCAPARCPVIVGNILLYRDFAHMVPPWSRFIAPVLAGAILPIMRGEKVP